MKTKQANNQSFQFMHFENILHLYYKHLVKMIKSKKYIPPSPVKLEREDSLNESESLKRTKYLLVNVPIPFPQKRKFVEYCVQYCVH